jgi:hypothetical protein
MATLDRSMVRFVQQSVGLIDKFIKESSRDEIVNMIKDCDDAISMLANNAGKRIAFLIVRGVAKGNIDDIPGAKTDFDWVLALEEDEQIRDLVKGFAARMQT